MIATSHTHICGGYEIKGDRSLDANCLGYSRELCKELKENGKDGYLVGFQHGKKQGHCMVVVNPFTTNFTVIESYNGQEFKIGDPLDYYLKDLIGGFPEKIWIINGTFIFNGSI